MLKLSDLLHVCSPWGWWMCNLPQWRGPGLLVVCITLRQNSSSEFNKTLAGDLMLHVSWSAFSTVCIWNGLTGSWLTLAISFLLSSNFYLGVKSTIAQVRTLSWQLKVCICYCVLNNVQNVQCAIRYAMVQSLAYALVVQTIEVKFKFIVPLLLPESLCFHRHLFYFCNFVGLPVIEVTQNLLDKFTWNFGEKGFDWKTQISLLHWKGVCQWLKRGQYRVFSSQRETGFFLLFHRSFLFWLSVPQFKHCETNSRDYRWAGIAGLPTCSIIINGWKVLCDWESDADESKGDAFRQCYCIFKGLCKLGGVWLM